MGNAIDHTFFPHVRKDFPSDRLESKYEPLYGFPGGRKVRISHATELELDSGAIQARFRDYCSHKLLKLRACKQDNMPFVWRCHHYRHAYEECQYHDAVLRMKDYERERRLDMRQKRILEKQKKAAEAAE